ncbi:hypothetical protein ACIBP6_30180 [Nonomuraea terrae]
MIAADHERNTNFLAPTGVDLRRGESSQVRAPLLVIHRVWASEAF